MTTEKHYELNDCKLLVFFDLKLIRITGPEALQQFLSKDIKARSEVLANRIKMDYFQTFNCELDVSNDSMIIEIWGHVYASYFAKAMKKFVKLKLVEEAGDFILDRSEVIDCGEREIDRNRKFWDTLSPFKGLISNCLPKKMR